MTQAAYVSSTTLCPGQRARSYSTLCGCHKQSSSPSKLAAGVSDAHSSRGSMEDAEGGQGSLLNPLALVLGKVDPVRVLSQISVPQWAPSGI